MGQACAQAEWAETGRSGLMVPCGVGHPRPRRRRALHGRAQGFGALLEHRCLRGMAIPTGAHTRHATILGPHAFQHRLWQLRPVVFGLALPERQGRRVAVGHRRPGQGTAWRVEVIEAQVKAFVGTNRQGQVVTQQSTAIRVNLLEGATERNPSAPLRPDALTTPPLQRCLGKELWRSGQGTMGTPHALEEQASHGFAGRELLLRLGPESCVDHGTQPSVVDDSSNPSHVIPAFDED